ncbi:MAG TPA: putative ABC exporter domain-containing protein [Gammaproteobacteria bacterium]|nr:putative ABC exporter domain-containing protein [Gammaproteobacteria bacterium]
MRLGIAGTLLYLRLTTATGWLTSRLRRLKQPKYLVGAVIGIAYIYFFFIARVSQSPAGRPAAAAMPKELLSIVPEIAAASLLLLIALNWIVPRGRAGLAFSEAEIAFLFPAPIARRTLIHYRLLSTLGALSLTALFMTLVSSRWGLPSATAWMRGVGWWVVIGTLSLHFTATSFVVTRLLDRGVSSIARSIAGLGVLALAIGVPLVWTLTALPAPTQQDLAGVPAVARYVEAALQSGPLPWLLPLPKLTVAPLLAADARAFLPALVPALLVLAAHYVWVLFSAVSFEEASIAKAEKRAVRLAAFRGGSLRTISAKKLRDPFRLRDTGRPETAFLWKNLLAMGRLFSPRSGLVAAAIVAGGCLWLSSAELRGGQALVATVATVVLVIVLLFGPQLARHDLRSDLKNADILKTYPIGGAQLVFGEMLAPIAVLSAIAWIALLAVALAAAAQNVPVLVRIAGPLAIGVCTPFFCALQLVIHNGLALVFPAWVQTVANPGEHGFDVLGQRLVFLSGQILLLALGLLPALIAALLTFFVTRWIAGPLAAGVLAWLVVLTVLGAEIWVGVRWLGERFTRFDLSSELRP